MTAPQEPKLDPANNRTIVYRPAPKPTTWAKLRRTFTPVRPTRTDIGGCLVAVALLVAGFVAGRCVS